MQQSISDDEDTDHVDYTTNSYPIQKFFSPRQLEEFTHARII